MKIKKRNLKVSLSMILVLTILMIPLQSLSAGVFAASDKDGGSSPVGAALSGDGSQGNPYLIQSADDWDTLADSVLAGKTYDNKFFLLKEDITAERGIGSADITSATAPVYAFSGTFDGGGHTLDFIPPADTNANYVAPFSIVKNATIRNLKVTGKITAYNNLSGLVGSTRGTLTIENVLSDVDVTGNFVGGFIGHGSSGDITLRSCAFTGDLNCTTLAGGLICWRGPTQWDSSSTSAVHMENCLFAGTVSGSADFHPIGFTQQTNVTQDFSNMWSTLGGKNNGKSFYNYQYQSASYKSTAATVTSGKSSSRPWMGYYDVIECLPVESTFTDAVNAWIDGSILALLTDVTTDSTITVPSGEHTLDLNGHGIKMTGNGAVIKVGSGSTLNMNDSDTGATHKFDVPDGAGLAVLNEASGTYTVNGGYITGGNEQLAGGVYIDQNGTFNMYGGCIIGNKATLHGGGVDVSAPGTKTAIFNMYGGSICYNSSTWGGGINVFGTAYVNEGCTIHHNTASNGGGGIELESGSKLYLNGSTVTENVVLAQNGGMWKGGGVHVPNGTECHLQGAVQIKDNYRETFGTAQSNVFVRQEVPGKVIIDRSLTSNTPIGVGTNGAKPFTVTSAYGTYHGTTDPSKYFTSDYDNYWITLNNNGEAEVANKPVAMITSGDDTSYYSDLSSALSAWTAGSTLKLFSDVTTNGTITVPSGEHTLDLNGHELKRTGATGSDNSGLVITVGDGVNLTVTGPGKITGGSGFHGGGIHVEGNSSLVLDDCEISGNTGHYGGGLYLKNGTITLKNGTAVKNNSATEGFGGSGIYAEGSGTLILEGGTFTNNEIRNNNQYAVFLAGNANAQISGAPVIYDNKYGSTQKNLYMFQAGDQHSIVRITGALTDGAKIGVGQTTGTGEITSGWKDKMGDADPSKYFTSDNNNYQVFLNGNGEAEIGVPPAACIISGETTTSYSAISDALNAWTAGSTLKLLSDVTTDSTITAPAGEHTLDLNGHGIKMTGNASAFTVSSGAKLIINDSNADTEHKFTLSNAQSNGAGLATVNDSLTSGYKTFNGGYITGGKGNSRSSWREGGAIYIEGEVEMYAGTLIGNGIHGTTHGGGFVTRENGRFVMHGGSIQNNAGLCGGACRLVGGSAEIDGGTIINNIVTNDGGAIHVGGTIPLVLKDCEISGNYAGGGPGAGIWMSNDGTTVSGKTLIKDNYVGSRQDNIEIPSGRVLYIGELTDGTSIGITMQSDTGVFTRGWKDNMGSADPSKYFTSDNTDYEVFMNQGGELEIGNNIVPDVSATGYEGSYDGKAHGITVSAPDGATIEYGTSEGSYTFTQSPTFTNAGTNTVYYKVSLGSYSPVFGSEQVKINQINATVTITGNNGTFDYDGKLHTVSGYTAKADTTLYDVTKDFSFSGNAEVYRTNAGKSMMGLATNMFTNTNGNFKTVTFNITDGYIIVSPIDVTVTITGHTNTVNYDGKAHSADGYDAVASSALYDVTKDFTYNGRAEAVRTDAGTTYMGLTGEKFENKNSNFKTVTFNVTDGYQQINPIDVTVTITGHNSTVNYDGRSHSADGYDAAAGSELYDVTKDFTFSGSANAERTNAGTTAMGLAVNQFENTNANFKTVTFNITDGYIRVNTVDAVITSAPHAKDSLVYNGSSQELVVAGTAEGGTMYYAIGSDSRSAPADSAYKTPVPTGTKVGNYYIWYKVIADSNHNNTSPACVKVTLAEKTWTTVSGKVYDSNNNPVKDATVSLSTGNKTVDTIISGSDGSYYFTAPAGVYNIIVKANGATVTDMVDISDSKTYDLNIVDANTDSLLDVSGTDSEIVVGGLNKEAESIRTSEGIASDKNVTVRMTVTPVSVGSTDAVSAIEEYAAEMNLEYYDFKVEKTIDSTTSYLDSTQTVLEIVIPCSFTNKQEVTVYRADGSGVQTLTESDSKEAGTFRVDANSGLVYIYTNQITTYALGYKPYYSVSSILSLGSFTGAIDVTLTKNGEIIYELKDVSSDKVSFKGVPKGKYSMTITWTDGAENTLTTPFEIK